MTRIMMVLLIYLFSASILKAHKIEGQIIDPDKNPIEGCVVVALNIRDSTYVDGCISDQDGSFIVKVPHEGRYLLKASMLGYKSQYLPCCITDTEIAKLNEIIMEEDPSELPDITVTGHKSAIEVKPGKTVYNLSETVSGKDGNLYDVLKRVPGIQIQSNGDISIDGKFGIKVYMNGKDTYLNGESLISYLRNLPSSSIEKIELISNPSAQFDASSKSGIIDIKTKKVNLKGVEIGGNAGYSQIKEYGSTYGSAHMNLNNSKFNLAANYSYYQGFDLNETFISREYVNPAIHDILDFHMGQEALRTNAYYSHNVSFSANYEHSQKISLSAYFNGVWVKRNEKETLSTDFFSNISTPDSLSVTNNLRDVRFWNLRGGINSAYRFSKKFQGDASFDFHLFNNANNHHQNASYADSEEGEIYRREARLTSLEGYARIYCGQLNILANLSERIKLGMGTNTTFVNIGNGAEYFNIEDGQREKMHWLNNRFRYNENINAGYLSLIASFGENWKIYAGIRVENANINGALSNKTAPLDSTFHHNYTNIFPSLQIQHQWNGIHQVSLLYSKRIIRPNYQDLSPAVTINDNYLYEQGNTNLKPEINHNGEISYVLKSHYSISIMGSYCAHPISKSYLVDDDKRVLVTPMNLTSDYSAGIRIGALNLNFFRCWDINAAFSFVFTDYSWRMDSEEFRNHKFTPRFHLGNQFQFPHGWSTELNGYYNGQTPSGQAVIGPLWSVSAGISKTFLEGRGTATLFADNVLSSRQIHIDVLGAAQRGWYNEKIHMKVGVNISIRFNKGNETNKIIPHTVIDESNRLSL